ncbi:hypothetical protein L3X38_008620 [Prunus dulcis]|uniref:BHLH domain-containing protein n=1 Tax=Prunus dulcis TaxID=3755 RepID=A0AAD4ZWU6_PRUDU|nr:hypothetical protein L3X38_008620 [Prunus dulcis]
MLPFLSWSDQNHYAHAPSLVNLMDGADSILSPAASMTETSRSAEASKSHKEAERRRRQRINTHLSTLRTLLPNTTRTDKASLLAEVVQHVRELRRQAGDLARQDGGSCCGGTTGSEPWPFPGESDEATVSYCDGEARLLKATLCCEDRPGLNRDLIQAIRSVEARAIRAEMMTIGGRTKNVVVMQWAGGGGEEEVWALKRALKAVVENRASGSGPGRLVLGNKRARVYGSVYEDENEY